MNRHPNIGVCLFALALVLLSSTVVARSDEDTFVQWASQHAIPISTLELTGSTADLRPLKALVGNARVVALGEPTHGAHEPLAFRNLLIRFLVEQMGFTAIALESGFTESWTINRFIGGGSGELRSTVRDGLSWGFGDFAENRELIEWARDYNAKAASAHRRKIRFYGIDLSGQGHEDDGPRGSIDFAVAYLSRRDFAQGQKIREVLEPILRRFNEDKYASLSPSEISQLHSCLLEIGGAIASNRSILIAASSVDEYNWAVHGLDVARQWLQHFQLRPLNFKDHSIKADEGPAIMARDFAMAQNVQWALANEGPNGRMIVFAHNAHVMNWREDGGAWSGIRQKPFMMGAFLRGALGQDLVIIGTSSSGASPGLPIPEPTQDSIDAALGKVGVPRLILDLRPARKDAQVRAWLSEQRPIQANIYSHFDFSPSSAVDALFFVEKLTPAHR